MSKGRLLAVIAVLLGVAGFAAMSIYGLKTDPSELPSALLNKPFPEFNLPSLDREAEQVTRKDLLGRPALVNVWATWCPTCRDEHEMFNQLAKQGVLIHGINYKDNVEKAHIWLRDLLNPYDIIITDAKGSLGMDLGVYGAPETFVIDKDGIIRYKFVGAVDEKVWRERLEPVYRELLTQ